MVSATPVSIRQDEECVSARARPSGRPEASVSGVEAAMLMLETRPKMQPWGTQSWAIEVFISQM